MILSDTNRFWLPGSHKQALHLATVMEGIREYICFSLKGKVYIEEITGGHLEYIRDDQLAQALNDFLVEKGILLMDRPLLPDNEWYCKP